MGFLEHVGFLEAVLYYGGERGTLDAVGLALFAVVGAERALVANAHAVSAVVLGAVTATFGGVVRDVFIGKTTLIAKREIYITAAFLAALVYVALYKLVGTAVLAAVLGFAAGFGLRAAAILFDWTLPTVEDWKK